MKIFANWYKYTGLVLKNGQWVSENRYYMSQYPLSTEIMDTHLSKDFKFIEIQTREL